MTLWRQPTASPSNQWREWRINEIATVPIYDLVKPLPGGRAWENQQGQKTLMNLTLVRVCWENQQRERTRVSLTLVCWEKQGRQRTTMRTLVRVGRISGERGPDELNSSSSWANQWGHKTLMSLTLIIVCWKNQRGQRTLMSLTLVRVCWENPREKGPDEFNSNPNLFGRISGDIRPRWAQL